MTKKVSIVTVVRNDRAGLEKTFQSVFMQSYKAIEYLVIDGKSTDGTVNIIESYREKLQYWVSEADTGIYNAMNKGILKATGDYVLFLNAGDYFKSADVIETLVMKTDNKEIVYGDIIYKSVTAEKMEVFPETLDFTFFADNSLPHPCTLIQRSLFDRLGLYDEKIRICADWAFFLNAIARHNVSYKHVQIPVTVFLKGGISSDTSKVVAEKELYFQQFFSFYFSEYLLRKRYESILYHFRKSRIIKVLSRFLPVRINKMLYNSF
jgi:glycosyltransferase involved in cell wall biosynthesis